MVTQVKMHLEGRGMRPGEYIYTYLDEHYKTVIEPGRQSPVREYDPSEWKGLSNEKKQIPVRKSLLQQARKYLDLHNTFTNELQRQLAVN